MSTQRSGSVVRPRPAAEQSWLADPAVRTTGEESMQARRAWMKMAPAENWLLRDLDPAQLDALIRMLDTDRAYRAAKAAAVAARIQDATEAGTRS